MLCNTAIFYDIENLLGLFSGKTNTVLHLDEIYRRVLETEGVHGVSIQRAYADWALPQHRNLRGSVLQVGIEPIQIFNTNQNDKVKNSSDVSLIIDAVDFMHKRPELENFVIASGDGIFAFLSKKLHEHGKRVIGCSFDKITNNIFRNSCDYFIAIEKNDASIIATNSKRKNAAPKSMMEIIEPEVSAPNFPRSKYTEALLAANVPVWHDANDASGCFHTVRAMMEGLFTDATAELPGLEISIFNNYMSYYLPNFKSSRHGFKRVSDLLRFILSGSPFCMHSLDANVLLLTPRATAQGKIMEDVNGLIITSASGAKYNSLFNLPSGEPFVYTFLSSAQKPVTAPPKKKPTPAKKPIAVAEEPAPPPEEVLPTAEKGSIRKWIKERFEELSAKNLLPAREVRKLITEEYSMATFGIRNPILKMIESRSNLNEQRTANGKVKYWKESFRFHGKTYIVYKEWTVMQHEERFTAWLSAFLK